MYTGVKWGAEDRGSSGGVVTWSFAVGSGAFTSFSATISDEQYRVAIRSAFSAWSDVADIEFREVSDSASTNIRLGFTGIDGAGGTLGFAYWQWSGKKITRAEIAFDLQERWQVGSKSGEQDFLPVAVHEIGHALGLDHRSSTDSIMHPYLGEYDTLDPVDISAIRGLYGKRFTVADLPADFDPLEYIASHADLSRALGANAEAGLQHYVEHGRNEGRTVTFDTLEYVASYGDLSRWLGATADGGARHFIEHGRSEGRTVKFDSLEYIASYGDLSGWLGSDADGGARHYIAHGRNEGRVVTFDSLEYIASYGDLSRWLGTNADGGARHYIAHGRGENRKVTFDSLDYIASNTDILRWLGANPDAGARHYIEHGRGEGRATKSFDAAQYLDNYSDLKARFGSDLDAATEHYIETGYWLGLVDELIIV